MGITVLPAGNQLERGGVPLYLQLIQILRTQIRSGEYKPGDLLPTEEALGRAFGVSRITVREALRGLTADGLIIRRRRARMPCHARSRSPSRTCPRRNRTPGRNSRDGGILGFP